MNMAAKFFLHSSFSIAGMAVAAAFLAVTIWHRVTSRRPRKGVEYVVPLTKEGGLLVATIRQLFYVVSIKFSRWFLTCSKFSRVIHCIGNTIRFKKL